METITETSAIAGPTKRFDEALQSLHRMLSGQLLISQDRCVDALLDLYNAAPSKLMRELIAQMISDIRYVTAVRAQLLRDDLTLLTGHRSA